MAIFGPKNAVREGTIATKAKYLAGNEDQYLKHIWPPVQLEHGNSFMCLEKVRRTWHVTVLFCMCHVLGLSPSGNLRGRKKGSGSIEDIQTKCYSL